MSRSRSLPDYVTAYTDRHGKTRYRFRRTGKPTVHFAGAIGSEEFWRVYLSWHNETPKGESRAAPGTFSDLIARYYGSSNWARIRKESTKRTYRGELERFRKKHGHRPVAGMKPRDVEKIIAGMIETPSAANNLLKRLSQILDYAVLIDMRKDNPTAAVKSLPTKGEGFHAWEEWEIAQFEARHKIGTKARLAFALLLYTGQRRSDVVTMARQKDGKVRVKQLKTEKPMTIPMHSALRAVIDATPVVGATTYLVTAFGKPFTAPGFGNKFREWCDEADLPQCSAHGLRKACARRMAMQGLSNQLIKSITGHSGDAEVALYTRSANQERMAEIAMGQMDNLANVADPVWRTDPEEVDNAG